MDGRRLRWLLHFPERLADKGEKALFVSGRPSFGVSLSIDATSSTVANPALLRAVSPQIIIGDALSSSTAWLLHPLPPLGMPTSVYGL
mmetsp:Transcript_32007/g.73066  ORF Transcript_32007/g.73066 Transcript_32007/m.73066 type:complete len:88 (-) Transcript_32007:6-269(-)